MRIEQLYYLVEVSKHKSITLTAEHIHVSQQNISVAIHNLEKELGVDLLVRSRKGVLLTKDGERFVSKAQEILDKIEALKSEFPLKSAVKMKLEGNLRIDVVPYMTMPDTIISFYKQNPQVNVILKENSPGEIIKNVVKGATDIGIIFRIGEDPELSEAINHHELNFDKIIDDKIYVCVGKKSPLRNKRSLTTTEIVKQKLIVSEDLYGWILEILKQYEDPSALQIQRFNSMQLYKKVIEEDLAVGFVTGIGLEKELIFKKGEVIPIPIEENNSIRIGVVYSSATTQTELSKAFIDYLKLTTQDYHS